MYQITIIIIILCRIKNAIAVTDNASLCGKPHNVTLGSTEEDILTSLGITLNGPVLSYPKLILTESRRIVTTDSKKTLRDNSCVLYEKEGSCRVGNLHKVVQSDDGTFAFVKTLIPSGETLCTDDTRINNHLLKMCSPRYVELFNMHMQC